jgi:hypothetical protein
MKIIVSISSVIVALALATLPAPAATYVGTGNNNGGNADGTGIGSVVVNNTASTITFTINSTQPMASWIFYAVELQIVGQAGSGYTGFANPFGPAVGISTGQNAVIDTYGTGATPYNYSGSWVAGSSVAYDAGGTGSAFATMTVPLSSLGLNLGDSFYFDVVSTYTSWPNGGPQSAYGVLDNTGWAAESDNSWQPWLGSNYYDSATGANSTFGTAATLYTVAAVPEPATLALLSGGAILLMAVRRNRMR